MRQFAPMKTIGLLLLSAATAAAEAPALPRSAPEAQGVPSAAILTPFCATLGLRFAGDALVLDREMNVGFGPTKRPTLVGLPGRPAPAARTKS